MPTPILRDNLVFDLDGTLIDTMQAYADIAAQVISSVSDLSFQESREAYLATSGDPFFVQLESILPGEMFDRKSVVTEFESRKKAFLEKMRLMKPEIEILRKLAVQGHSLFISSNNFQDLVNQCVGEHGTLFREVLGYRENFAKGREQFSYLMREHSIEPEAITFIGDSLSDFRKAKDAGFHFVGVLGTFSRDQFLALDSKIELVGSLAELCYKERGDYERNSPCSGDWKSSQT